MSTYTPSTTFSWSSISTILKWLVAGLVVHHIYSKVAVDFSLFNLRKVNFNWYLIALALVLSPINTLVEAIKWKVSTSNFIQLNIGQSVASVLYGNAAGIITPAKVGEYVGRQYYLHPDQYAKGVLANLICSLSQNTTNIVFGVLGLSMIGIIVPSFNGYFSLTMTLLAIAFALLIITLIFNLQTLLKYILQWSFLKKVLEKWNQNLDSTESNIDMDKMLVLAFIRYAIYGSQYLLLVYGLNFNVDPLSAMFAIALIFFAQTGLWLPSGLSFLARAEISLVVWGLFNVQNINILMASIVLWSINVALPALVGSFYLLIKKT